MPVRWGTTEPSCPDTPITRPSAHRCVQACLRIAFSSAVMRKNEHATTSGMAAMTWLCQAPAVVTNPTTISRSPISAGCRRKRYGPAEQRSWRPIRKPLPKLPASVTIDHALNPAPTAMPTDPIAAVASEGMLPAQASETQKTRQTLAPWMMLSAVAAPN